MTQTKHTAGPWNVAPAFRDDSQYRNRWRITAKSPHVTGKMQTVCELNGPWDEKNYAANARLIAAAPELLEACKAILAKLELLNAPGTHDPIEACVYQAKAAIAKAEINP